MAPLIIIALSNLATMLLTAWLLHRSNKGLSPMPSTPRKIQVTDGDNHEDEQVYMKGRPLV